MIDHTAQIERLKLAFVSWQKDSDGEKLNAVKLDEFVNTLYSERIAINGDYAPDEMPQLYNLSAAFLNRFVYVPEEATPPEFLYVPSTDPSEKRDDHSLQTLGFMSQWNMNWESGKDRHQIFAEDIPDSLASLKRHFDQNIFLLPMGFRNRYYAYAPLFHMLPKRILDRHGLPVIKKGFWPFISGDAWLPYMITSDFDSRLEKAFADLIWSQIDSGSGLSAFSGSYPLRLLAHNLDYWLPHAYQVAQNRLRDLGRVEVESEQEATTLQEARVDCPPGVTLEKPRMGGHLWYGEDDAKEAMHELVEVADGEGKLRSIIDAVRSNRVQDDFSDRWSFAKEDFERKIYNKRSKISVRFVELDDTIPVLGPESEVHENLMWEDFIGLLDPKERQIVVLLRSGHTKLGDVAAEMGYANHSPVSKALSKIRTKALRYLE